MNVGRSKRDCHEIRLASAKLLPATSLRLAIIDAGSSLRSIAVVARLECPGAYQRWAPGSANKWKYGDAAHSRFAGQELDLICNHKFV